MSFVSRAPGFAPLFAVLLAACGDDGPRPPPAVDGVWVGEVILSGEQHVFQVELGTWKVHVATGEGWFGPHSYSVALLEGSATVQVGDSIVEYSVDGSQATIVDLDLELSEEMRYTFTAFYLGGDVLDGRIYDYRPPDGLFQGQVALMLRRVSGT